MSGRKRIGLFTAYPETTHVRRILKGIMGQCEKYNYDLCVFASSVHFSFPHEDYVRGEANIFSLANLDRLDGLILDSVTLTGDPEDRIRKKLMSRLLQYDKLPKCALELPIEGVHLIPNNDEAAIREQCRHAIEVHNRKKICILTGTQGNKIAETRLSICLDEIRRHGLEVLPEHIVYGDFYYFSGDALARKIAANEIPRPDAVICAGDCMAIGLVDRLVKLGVRVPEDVLVIGFDSSDEGAVNQKTISSYEPSDKEMGANAVDYLRSVIEPGAELFPYHHEVSAQFHAGASCGCMTDPSYTMKHFRDSLYISSYNQADEEQNGRIGIGTFMEGYVMEGFTASGSAEECFRNICYYADLLKPFRFFYLCLTPDWRNVDEIRYEGYPEKMQLCVSRSMEEGESSFGKETSVSFRTETMLPALDVQEEKPSVFYFSPVHFDGALLGYAVLQRELSGQPSLNVVYRNWLRYLNNALEMMRIRERLQSISVRDEMTGAYNRRGMYAMYRSMLAEAGEGDALFVGVADMDGLKYINDTFGHSEGDFGIRAVSDTLQSIAKNNEICVRSGGDEFFLIGIGPYKKEDEADRAREFAKAIEQASGRAEKPYAVSASIGCVVFPDCRQISLDAALSEADGRMYRYKVKNKRHRSV